MWRKLTSILILSLFLLFSLGYYGLYLIASLQLHHSLQTRILNEEVSSENLKSTSIPITFPYMPDQDEYQTVAGKSVKIDGKFYKVVKMRYASDTLHLVYINDRAQEKLHENLKDWINSQTLPYSNRQDTQVVQLLVKNYLPVFQELHLTPLYGEMQPSIVKYANGYKSIVIPQPTPPPRV